MKVIILEEAGLNHALCGISLSYRNDELCLSGRIGRMRELAPILAQKEKGHNKFLRQIKLWLEIDAPRYWWAQMDTYQIGVTKQSESTMHTITKRLLTQKDFEYPIIPDILNALNKFIEARDWQTVKNNLPEGFLQRRIVDLNYEVLRTIIKQRHDHKLPEWKIFVDTIYKRVNNPEFLPEFETLQKNH